MNLSQRLDMARSKRERGETPTAEGADYRLRLDREQRTYDGTHLRTGEALTEERWRELQAEEEARSGLPAWNPNRANEEITYDWQIDLTPGEGAEVIDLRARAARQADEPDDVFEMPAWARSERVYEGPADA